jgi:hypothetical protein
MRWSVIYGGGVGVGCGEVRLDDEWRGMHSKVE